MNVMSKIDGQNLLQDVTTFVWAEADLLDRKDYDTWLDLWVPEGFYTMPIGDTAEADFDDALNLCRDNDKMRRDRIARFKQGFSISSAPPAQTIRTNSRFVVTQFEGDAVSLRCAQHLVEDKFGRQRVWAANVHYDLRQSDTGWKIRNKVVRLLNSDGMLNSFSYVF